MNKQLAELAAKSGFDVGIHNGLILGNFSDMYKLDKFAELIVRECGIALSPMLRDMVSRGQAFDLIKQHFGVE